MVELVCVHFAIGAALCLLLRLAFGPAANWERWAILFVFWPAILIIILIDKPGSSR